MLSDFPKELGCWIHDGFSNTAVQTKKYLGKKFKEDRHSLITATFYIKDKFSAHKLLNWWTEHGQYGHEFTIHDPHFFGGHVALPVRMTNDLNIVEVGEGSFQAVFNMQILRDTHELAILPPEQITDLVASTHRVNTIELTWSGSVGADSYDVFENGAMIVSDVTSPHIISVGIVEDVPHTYTIVSKNALSGDVPSNASAGYAHASFKMILETNNINDVPQFSFTNSLDSATIVENGKFTIMSNGTDSVRHLPNGLTSTILKANIIKTDGIINIEYIFGSINKLTEIIFEATCDVTQITNADHAFYGTRALTSIKVLGADKIRPVLAAAMLKNSHEYATVMDLSWLSTDRATEMYESIYGSMRITCIKGDIDTLTATDKGNMFSFCDALVKPNTADQAAIKSAAGTIWSNTTCP